MSILYSYEPIIGIISFYCLYNSCGSFNFVIILIVCICILLYLIFHCFPLKQSLKKDNRDSNLIANIDNVNPNTITISITITYTNIIYTPFENCININQYLFAIFSLVFSTNSFNRSICLI